MAACPIFYGAGFKKKTRQVRSTKAKCEISVIMGVYNQYNQIQLMQAVNSILVQSFSDFEFIIYDDGSDGKPAEYISNLAALDDRIRVIRNEENRGLAFSLNRCIGEARGKYLARMDADDISLPDRLQREYDFLEKHPEYAWVGTNAKVFEHENIWGTLVMAEEPNQYNFLPFSPFIHPSVMFRRELFETGGGYEVAQETLRCEDYELFLRLYMQGLRGYNLQEVLFLYRQGISSYKKRTCRSRWNEAKIRARYFPKLQLPRTKQYLYIARPVITGLLPYWMIAFYKKQRLRRLNGEERGRTGIYESLGAYTGFLYQLGSKGSPRVEHT